MGVASAAKIGRDPARTKTFGDSVRRTGVRGNLDQLRKWVFLAAMLAGSALITAMSLPYFDFDELPPFVIEKLPVRFEALWLAALRIHVATAAVAFPLCLALVTRPLQRRATLHRWLGRATGVLVLVALVPSGAVLAFDAKGGLWVTAGFLLSAAIVGASMLVGVRAARRRDMRLHAHAMRHVLGQMSVAVVSRAMLVAFDAFGVDPELAYTVALWLPVLAAAGVVELLPSRPRSSPVAPVPSVERTPREVAHLALVVRVRALVRPVPRLGR